MFRLIATALTLTFALLFLIGNSSEQGVSDSEVTPAGIARSGSEAGADTALQYVARPHQRLQVGPNTTSGILRILPHGAPLLPIGVTEGDFVKVRDRTGRVGYVRGDVLSAAFPG